MDATYHAKSSARRFGGKWEDYYPIHAWFDESKVMWADHRHRALRHHAEGIALAIKVFGPVLKNSAGKEIPTRHIGEQHVNEDMGRIPSMQDWLANIHLQPWMLGPRDGGHHPITILPPQSARARDHNARPERFPPATNPERSDTRS